MEGMGNVWNWKYTDFEQLEMQLFIKNFGHHSCHNYCHDMEPSTVYYGGVEGGGTNVIVVILDSDGKIVARQDGPGINPYLVGIPKVAETVTSLFEKAKADVGISCPLTSLGLCSSGFLQPDMQDALKAELERVAPGLVVGPMYIDNDCPGVIYTCGDDKAAVLISGTGSMGQILDAEGKPHNCGGWGHMFGDEGSAIEIATTAIQRIFQALDGYASDDTAPPDVTAAFAAMLRYFDINDKNGMLDVMYKNFIKAKVAGFTKELAALASAGDAFSLSLLKRTGRRLGRMARVLASVRAPTTAALSSSSSAATKETTVIRDFKVVCVGSVWKSLPLFQTEFIDVLTSVNPATGTRVESFQLLRLKDTSAVGAAWKASTLTGKPAPVKFNELAEIILNHAV